ncbi:MAG: acetyl-CoA carboxylase biotin carboxylase subunit [Deltaproteobacteria bacterium]|nr:acetyl-CoA carboxylase biotin carboxylase subunit [Deltaproteobacteria bacterium]
MFKRVLIANRGEIAVRVIRACRELGVETVAVYSDADRSALHVQYADYAVHIGPSPSAESYLVISKIIDAAKKTGAEAIHPGYGFLSERAPFARACKDAGIVFIGPTPDAIERMGDKVTARQIMQKANVPVVPGTDVLGSEDEVLKAAEHIGFPVMFKASAGGGGKGMRLVRSRDEVVSALRGVRSEAKSSFGDDRMYMEKFVEKPRHVEVQVLGDTYGNIIHLYERECSLQRRHQKVIEESPSMAITDAIREQMGKVAVDAAKAVNYVGAGTIEFLVDARQNFYFLEMNTRIQVEHPVTELVTGVDLVKAQIEIAAGERLLLQQKDIQQRGWAVECRIYAEDPAREFFPSPGKIEILRVPGGNGIRDDSGVYEGWEVPIFYDPMISKLCAYGRTRTEAIQRMRRALQEYTVEGIVTNIPFHRWALQHPRFIAGDIDTGFIEQEFHGLPEEDALHREVILTVAAIAAYQKDQALAGSLPLQGATRGGVSAWRGNRWR